MAEAPAKKLKLPLYLNPVVSQADQLAMTALEHWYEQTRQSCGGAGPELESLIREFHRDLYLSGLHLYLINPRLCRHVAEALQEKPTIEALDRELKACGLWVDGQEAANSNVFSSEQLEQLQNLLGGLNPSPGSSHDSTELLLQMTAMGSELKQLRALVEEQSKQLRRIKAAAPAEPAPPIQNEDGTEEMDVSEMADQMEKIHEIRKKGVF